MTHLYHRGHYKMHVKGLATFDLVISRTEGRNDKILSPIDSTHQITQITYTKNSIRTKVGFDPFRLNYFDQDYLVNRKRYARNSFTIEFPASNYI